jgi:hypothetical protein
VNKSWAYGGGPLGITAMPVLNMYGNDNECSESQAPILSCMDSSNMTRTANVPSDWNDRINEIGMQEDGDNCEFHQDINCGGNSIYYNRVGVYPLPSYINGQISSFKCWRSDGNNNSPY